MYCKKRLLEVNRLEINFNYKEERKMKPLKTLSYEWHLRWVVIDDKGNETGYSELQDSGIESLEELKTWFKVTADDIDRGYCLTDDISDGKNKLAYRLQLARYSESKLDDGYETAIILDNQLEDYFTNGVRVPKRFKQEFARNYEWASIL